VERGVTESPGDAAERAALVPRLTPAGVACGFEASAAGCGEHSVASPVPLRACSELESLVGRSRLIRLCCRALSGHALIEMPADEPSGLMG